MIILNLENMGDIAEQLIDSEMFGGYDGSKTALKDSEALSGGSPLEKSAYGFKT